MNKERIVKICDAAINWLILAIIFLVPLFFNIFSYTTFEIDKIALFRILVETGLFLYLIKILITGKLALARGKAFYIFLALFSAIFILSNLVSEYKLISFWGSYWRGMGLFTYLHIFAFIFLVYQNLETDGENKSSSSLDLKKIFLAAVLSAFFSSLYGLAQVYGFDFLRWEENPFGTTLRASSTLGQPNFLGSYLLLVLPPAFYLLVYSKNKKARIFYLLALVFQLWALVATYSRGAWLGLAGLMAGLFLIRAIKSYKKLTLAGLLIVLVLFTALFNFKVIDIYRVEKFNYNQDFTLLLRLESFTNLAEGSTGMRAYYFKAAWSIIKEKLLFGHGLETQRHLFYKYYEPDYAVYEKINVYPDRAHSEILDILIVSGVAGFFVWFSLFGYLLYLASNFSKSALPIRKKRILAVLFSAIFSYCVSILFGFAVITTAVYFFLYLAIIFKMTGNNFSPEENSRIFEKEFFIRKSIGFILAATLLLFLGYMVYGLNIKNRLADCYFRMAMVNTKTGDASRALGYYYKAIDANPGESFYPSNMTIFLIPAVSQINDKEKEIILLERFKESLLGRGYDNLYFEGKVRFGVLLGEIGKLKGGSAEEWKEADKVFYEILQKAPGFARPYYDWGNIYFSQKRYSEALNKYYEALIRYPDTNHPQLNNEHRQDIVDEMSLVYEKIIDIKIINRDFNSAEKIYKKAIRLAPFNYEFLARRSEMLRLEGENDEYIKSLKHLRALYPGLNWEPLNKISQ
ncbi:MAG: O-antigen ligase family protein [Patescibacteria group bacterium]